MDGFGLVADVHDERPQPTEQRHRPEHAHGEELAAPGQGVATKVVHRNGEDACPPGQGRGNEHLDAVEVLHGRHQGLCLGLVPGRPARAEVPTGDDATTVFAAAWGGVLPHATDERAALPAVKPTAQMTTAGTSLSRRSMGRLARPAPGRPLRGIGLTFCDSPSVGHPDIWCDKSTSAGVRRAEGEA